MISWYFKKSKSPKNSFCKFYTFKRNYWPSNWNGFEKSKYFDIDCTFPIDSIFEFIKINQERTIFLIWKSGVLIEESLANILLDYSENKSTLMQRKNPY